MVDVETDIVGTLKARARILHRKLKNEDPQAERLLRRLPELRNLEIKGLVETVQRRHCLKVVARSHGFDSWAHVLEVLTKTEPEGFGKLLCPPRCEVLTNVWCRSHDEAVEARAQYGGMIVPYMHQFLIASDDYLRELGLDPGDADLVAIGRDWLEPADGEARRRICIKIVAANLAFENAWWEEVEEAR